MWSSTACVASTGDAALRWYRSSSSAAESVCRSAIGYSSSSARADLLPAQCGEVVCRDRRAAPQALQALVADRELRQLKHVDGRRVRRELALDVAEQLGAALRVGRRVVGGDQLAEGLR